MSIKRMTAVWDSSRASGSALLLLLAIADNASDDGLAWPGLESLAQRARISKRAVIKQLKHLEETRELLVYRRPGQHNYYLVNVNFTDADRRRAFETLAQRLGEPVGEIERGFCAPAITTPPDTGEPQYTSTGEPQFTTTGEPQFTTRPVTGEPQFTSTGEPQFTRSVIRTVIDIEPPLQPEAKAPHAQTNTTSAPEKPVVVVVDSGTQNWLDKTAMRASKQPATSSNDPDFARICSAYENNIAIITPFARDELMHLLNEYPAAWIEESIRIAVEQNKRKLSYIRGILRRWREDGKDGHGKPGAPKAPPVYIPRGVPGCPECGGAGMWADADGKSVPCPACLEAERAAKKEAAA